MGDGLQFLDIIFFAMVAGFIFLRLRSVLGRRTGNERQRPSPVTRPESKDDNVVSIPNRPNAPPPPPGMSQKLTGDAEVDEGLRAIIGADPSYRYDEFVQGARAAYEMIVAAFAEGDRDTLKMLLSEEVYGNFVAAIDDRESRNQTMQTSITAVRATEVIGAALVDRTAEITVKFVSEMVSATKDAEGNIVGEAPREREVTDIWTFAHDTSSSDPNWVLIETRSEH
ncbi:MAG: Tim44/TimA family putative adaptor protein [Alphaproteobacteria bacterium]